MAIAYDAGTGEDAAARYGSATADSNVNVTVVSGLLTLDAVPDFGFGNGASGSTISLKNNDAEGSAADGNKQGILQVTDSRAAQADGETPSTVKKGDTPGFSLQAQLAAFTTDSTPADDTQLSNFTMKLNPQEVLDGAGDAASTGATPMKTDLATLKSDGKTPDTVMNPTAGSYKVGSLVAKYTGENDGATLTIPEKLTTNDAANSSAASYKSVITWTLNAAPTIA